MTNEMLQANDTNTSAALTPRLAGGDGNEFEALAAGDVPGGRGSQSGEDGRSGELPGTGEGRVRCPRPLQAAAADAVGVLLRGGEGRVLPVPSGSPRRATKSGALTNGPTGAASRSFWTGNSCLKA